MVENPREAPGADTIRPLNLPTPIVVEMQGRRPVAITLRRRRYEIAAIDDTWEVADEWWRQHPISRAYYRCILDSGVAIVVYRDLLTDTWHRQEG